MNIIQTFKNETNGKTIRVLTDATGTYCEKSEVLTEKEVELARDGHELNAEQTNKLFAYWHGSGHKVARQSTQGQVPRANVAA